eukprot:Lithocolla_globosa_v1_NODE_373_length_4251_cov_19.634890.p3 type:complete len:216 gc:universal NODE_373_length_4251_cov_19.634890:179-826(+)
MVVTQLYEMDLARLVHSPDIPLAVPTVFTLSWGIAQALQGMHNQNIVHRDVKPQNVLIELKEDTLTAVLCDFGLSQAFDTTTTMAKMSFVRGMSPRYTAPELFNPDNSDRSKIPSFLELSKGDVYSFGCIVYEMLERQMPFKDLNSVQEIADAVTNGERPSFKEEPEEKAEEEMKKLKRSLRDIAIHCWSQKPDARPNFSMVSGLFQNLFREMDQ